MDALTKEINSSKRDINLVASLFGELVQRAVDSVNSDFGPRRLAKASRAQEPLPVDTRLLSSFRTRIGTMLEYALSTAIDGLMKAKYGDNYSLTFAVAHEYPDFYLRGKHLNKLLRVEMKAVDAESDEQAAKFETATLDIEKDNDLLLLIGWTWKPIDEKDPKSGEFPFIFTNVVLPASAIADERDIRLELTGGKLDGKLVLVPSRKAKGTMVRDPKNYGKLWRLVHRSRHGGENASPAALLFLGFLQEIQKHAPRKRLKKKKD